MIFNEWVLSNFLDFQVLEGEDERIFLNSFDECCLLKRSNKDGLIFDNEFNFIFTQEEKRILGEYEIKLILFEFGGRFYYTEFDEGFFKGTKIKGVLNDLLYIGKAKTDISNENFSHLGIHSGYEILNGSGDFTVWINKAKFFGLKSLGICDKGTLAGVLNFQLKCLKSDIKPIIGATYEVEHKIFNNNVYEYKFFVKDEIGWQSILKLNHIVNVNKRLITFEEIRRNSAGLILIASNKSFVNDNTLDTSLIKSALKMLKISYSGDFYYQFDTVKFSSIEKDNDFLISQKRYLQYLVELVTPVYISDSFYVEKENKDLKIYLNKLSRNSEPSSENQYFKCLDEIYSELSELFDPESRYGNCSSSEFFDEITFNTKVISGKCNFTITTGTHRLPSYDFEYKNKSGIDLFYFLLEEGFQSKIKSDKNTDEYLERLEIEVNLVVNANLYNYFLILWDIIEFCKKNNIEYGVGRGSVGGSLIAYLLDIIKIDPIEHGLLFERFLNEARFSGERAKSSDSMPDVDIDFQASRREEVKQYIIERYGFDNVCYVGSFTTIRLKGGLKDLGRIDGKTFSNINFITSLIPEQVFYSWSDLFKFALIKKPLKDFIQKERKLVNLIKFALDIPKARSIHASALIITPNKDNTGNPMTIYNWMPLRLEEKENGQSFLVSEWEGEFVERAGFLKEDILGLKLLDEFQNIKKLLKDSYNKKINLLKIPFSDLRTFSLFQQGATSGIFQFSTFGMKSYCQFAMPDRFEDLVNMTSLYRPGPIGSGAHKDYALIKSGVKKPEYDFNLKEVTEPTYGLYIFQEQIMKAANVLGGLTLVESDNLRTAMKKFDKAKMDSYSSAFIEGALSNGATEKEAKKIWNKLQKFSGYGFNKSHASAYSMMSYWHQYLKANYPLVFWATALQFADSPEDTISYLSEKERFFPKIKIIPPDVNNSSINFEINVKENKIYWSFLKIKGIAEKTAMKIINARREGGNFTDLDDFKERVGGKGLLVPLILSGAFDNIYNISQKNIVDRRLLIEYLFDISKEEMPEEFQKDVSLTPNFWNIKQQEIANIGLIDFYSLVFRKNLKMSSILLQGADLEEINIESEFAVAGIIDGLFFNVSKRGSEYARIVFKSNNTILSIMCWDDPLEVIKDTLIESKKNKEIICLNIVSEFDRFDKTIRFFIKSKSKVIKL